MTELAALAQLTAAAAMVFLAAGVLVVVVAVHGLRRGLRRLEAQWRVRFLRALALAPWAMALAGLALVYLPSLLGWAGLAADHCHLHGSHHPHLCLIHPPAIGLPNGLFAVVALALVAAGASVALRQWREIQARRRLAALHRLAGDRLGSVRVVESARAFACAGLGSVLVSRRLSEALDADHLHAVIAHERAHLARGDTRVAARAAVAVQILPKPTRRVLLTELRLAQEELADADAAGAVGSRWQVAEAIVQVTRLARAPLAPGPEAPAFTGGDVDARVRTLLAPRRSSRWVGTTTAALCFALAVAMTLGWPALHHFTEHLLAHFAQ